MKLQLPQVTLIIADGLNAHRAKNVIDICKSKCDFGAIKLLTHLPVESEYRVEIMPLKSLVAYSIFCLTEMYKHIETEFVLVVQRDGWILNPDTWTDDWLQYDYVAPLFVQHDDVGSGGFSLRSKRIMEAAALRTQAVSGRTWDGTDEDAHLIQQSLGNYEDGVLSLQMKYDGFKYLPKDEAGKFCQGGNRNGNYYYSHSFGFHGDRQNINHQTGFVSPVCIHGGENCECRNEHQKELMRIEQ